MIGAGQELGGYTIIKRIGGGGLGEVFLAQHRRVNRRAAVKVLLPELAQKASVLEQFFKEARNTSLIRHPAIVEILDCDIVDGQPFVITEFLEGESLGTYLARVGMLAPDLAFLLGVMSSVAGAVAAAHLAGIMHRDLKPENIYLQLPSPGDPAVTVKVLDFGIAKLSREDGGPSQTKTGLWLASPKYMAPEQCRGTGRPDARSDIYALGCIFYEALCGKPPFEGPGIADLIVAHVSQPPKPPIKLVPELAPKLNTLVLRMLAKKPEERPQTMEQVVTTLRDSARALGIDLEGQLLPLVPVERPTALLGAALAGAAPKPSVSLVPPAPLPPFAAPAPMPAVVSPAVVLPVVAAPAPAATPVAAAPKRQVVPTVVAPDRQPTPAVEMPARPAARAFPRTLIAGADQRQAIAAGRLPDAPIEAFAGGTMVMEPSARPAELPRPAPARPQPDAKIRAQVGGTRIMEQAAEPEPPEEEPPEDDDEEASFDGAPEPRAAGSDRTMRVPLAEGSALGRVITLLTSRAGLAALGAIAVVALVIVLVRLLSGGPPPQHLKRAEPHEVMEPPPHQEPAPPAVPPPHEEPAPLPSPATVVIDIQGLGADTRVMVDDQVVTLPVRVPRGPEVHRFTLRPPHGAERTIEIDGTRDRVIELVMAPDEKPARPAAAPAHPHAPPKVPARGGKRQPGLPDLKPITDI